MRNTKAFTLIELMVVILIVGILAAASVPLMRGRVDSAKWAEAQATAGTIRNAARVYFAEHGVGTNDMTAMGLTNADLTGTYFNPTDYTVTTDASGNVTVVVTATKANAPKSPATKTLGSDGTWQ